MFIWRICGKKPWFCQGKKQGWTGERIATAPVSALGLRNDNNKGIGNKASAAERDKRDRGTAEGTNVAVSVIARPRRGRDNP